MQNTDYYENASITTTVRKGQKGTAKLTKEYPNLVKLRYYKNGDEKRKTIEIEVRSSLQIGSKLADYFIERIREELPGLKYYNGMFFKTPEESDEYFLKEVIEFKGIEKRRVQGVGFTSVVSDEIDYLVVEITPHEYPEEKFEHLIKLP